jgi:hypothetical protein
MTVIRSWSGRRRAAVVSAVVVVIVIAALAGENAMRNASPAASSLRQALSQRRGFRTPPRCSATDESWSLEA